jgi:hypothetical protein
MTKILKYTTLLASLSLTAVSAVATSYTESQPMDPLLAQTQHLDEATLEKALIAFENAHNAGITDSHLLTIIDYSQPSSKPRLWVFDLENDKLLYEELVSHGRGSGDLHANKFSNTPESYQSSLGVFITEETYHGRNGYSLRLEGLEENFNHLARDRAIVIHGANYVDPAFVDKHGRLGRSHGCPAVNPAVNKELINTIKGGSLVFAYYPDQDWLSESEFLQADNDNIEISKL